VDEKNENFRAEGCYFDGNEGIEVKKWFDNN
jgi:hypothetical protein